MKIQSFFLSLACMCIMFGCTAEGKESPDFTPKGVLKSFRLSQINKVYHANIDDKKLSAVIGGIEYGALVTDVSYQLEKGATISPDPRSFLRDWPAEATFIITKDDQKFTYKVTLPQYIGHDPSDGDDSNLIFSTDFDETNGIPDPEVWTLTPKGNSTWNAHMSGSYDQAYVEDGKLILRAEVENGVYKTGGLESVNKKSFRNARIDIRAKFDKTGRGGFPALWLMPQTPIYRGWPDCGEIDIMELLNNEPIIHQTIHSHYKNTLNYTNPMPTKTTGYNVGEYNTYSVEINDEELIFFVNNQKTFSYPNLHLEDEAVKKQWPFSTDFYIILNYALGGAGTWPGPIYDADLPLTMSVDWIKVKSLTPIQ